MSDADLAEPAEPGAGRPRTSPYQGLIPYGEEDAAYFFGRDRARDIVLDNLRAYRLSVLYGPSGVGKSSLLRAGVVRHVREAGRRRIAAGEPAEYAAVVFGSWSGDPLAGLRDAISATLDRLSPGLGSDLPDGSLGDAIAAAAQRLDGALLVILDQFEEYFLYHSAQDAFVAELGSALVRPDAAASVLISIREDALSRLDSLTGRLPGLLDHLVRIEHLDRAAAREAIERPLDLWNREHEPVTIEPELVEAVLDGVRSGRLDAGEFDGAGGGVQAGSAARIQTPYLQLVLTRLWEEERRRGSPRLRLETLVELRGAERIVARHVDDAIATLTRAEQAVAALVLHQLVTPSGTKIALRTADLAEYAQLDEATVGAVLERLTRDARILQAIGDTRYEIYHDALARPILAWRRRWQAARDRARQRRRYRFVAAIATGLLATVVVVTVLALLAVRARRDAERKEAEAASVALASAALDRIGERDVSLLLALAALQRKDRPEARDAMIAAREAAGPDAALAIMREHTGAVGGDVVFVDSGRAIAAAGIDGFISIFDAATHRPTGDSLGGPGSPVNALAVSRDGRTLAAGGEDGSIRLWDVATGRPLGAMPTRAGRVVLTLAFSPDGRTLASAGDGHDVGLWDVATRAPLERSITVSERFVARVAFSPDGRTLASLSAARTVRLWDVRTGRRLLTLASASRVNDVAFSPDGRTLALAGRSGILLRSVRSSRTSALRARPQDDIVRIAFSPDGARVAGVGARRAVYVWDVAGRRASRVLTGPAAQLSRVAFGANGRIAAVGGDGKVWLFDAAVSRELPRHAEGPINDIAFDPTSARIATAGYDGTVRLADARGGRAIGPPLLGPGAFSSLAFSSRRDEVAAGSDDGRVLVFDLSAGRAAQRHVVGQRTAVRSVAFSPDGTLIASGGYEDDPLIVLSDAESYRPRGRPLAGHAKSVNALAFSPDGRELASASADGTVRRWSIATRRQIGRPFAPHAGEVDDVAFSPDGQTLASAGEDGSIWLQDLRGGSLRRLSSGDDSLASIAFTPDGSMLVAGGARGAALLDVASGRQLGERLTAGSGSPNGFSAVAVSPDGRSFATAEEAGARLRPGIIWPDPRTLSVEICRLVGSGLTRAEWSRYAPGIAYEPMCDA